MQHIKSPESRNRIRSYYLILDREMKRLHDLLKNPELEGVIRTQAQAQLEKLHRCFYRNTLSDYGVDETKMRLVSPMEVRGVSIPSGSAVVHSNINSAVT